MNPGTSRLSSPGKTRRTRETARISLPAAAWLLCALLLAGCSREPGESRGPAAPAAPGRVLIVGVDGATNVMIEPMIARGEMPNLAGLRERGVAGSMRPQGPLLSPRIWTSLATGKTPAEHGIEDWIWFDESDIPHLYSSADRNGHALWNIASAAGLRVGVVNWLVTHPPEKIDGVMVSDHVLPGFSRGQLRLAGQFARARKGEEVAPIVQQSAAASAVYPAAWTERVVAASEEGEAVSTVANPFHDGTQTDIEVLAWLSQYLWSTFENDGAIVRIALAVQRDLDPDLLMVYLPGIDRSSHLIWPRRTYFDRPATAPELEDEPLADRDPIHFDWVRAYYRYIDELIGRLMEGYGPRDLVVIVSDHGFERGEDGKWPPGVHESDSARDGVLYAAGPRVRAGTAPAHISMNDLTPTVLAWLGLPVGADMAGTTAGFLEPGPIRRVATHDTGEIERPGGGSEAAAGDDKRIEELRLLGYVD